MAALGFERALQLAAKVAVAEERANPKGPASVMYNRTRDKRYSGNLAAVVAAKGQFIAYSNGSYKGVSTNSPEYKVAYDHLKALYAGEEEPVTSALEFRASGNGVTNIYRTHGRNQARYDRELPASEAPGETQDALMRGMKGSTKGDEALYYDSTEKVLPGTSGKDSLGGGMRRINAPQREKGAFDSSAALMQDRNSRGQKVRLDPAQVKVWQQALVDNGFMPAKLPRGGSSVDGKFGPLTRASTKSFQEAIGANPDGVVGPETYQAMNAYASGMPENSPLGKVTRPSEVPNTVGGIAPAGPEDAGAPPASPAPAIPAPAAVPGGGPPKAPVGKPVKTSAISGSPEDVSLGETGVLPVPTKPARTPDESWTKVNKSLGIEAPPRLGDHPASHQPLATQHVGANSGPIGNPGRVSTDTILKSLGDHPGVPVPPVDAAKVDRIINSLGDHPASPAAEPPAGSVPPSGPLPHPRPAGGPSTLGAALTQPEAPLPGPGAGLGAPGVPEGAPEWMRVYSDINANPNDQVVQGKWAKATDEYHAALSAGDPTALAWRETMMQHAKGPIGETTGDLSDAALGAKAKQEVALSRSGMMGAEGAPAPNAAKFAPTRGFGEPLPPTGDISGSGGDNELQGGANQSTKHDFGGATSITWPNPFTDPQAYLRAVMVNAMPDAKSVPYSVDYFSGGSGVARPGGGYDQSKALPSADSADTFTPKSGDSLGSLLAVAGASPAGFARESDATNPAARGVTAGGFGNAAETQAASAAMTPESGGSSGVGPGSPGFGPQAGLGAGLANFGGAGGTPSGESAFSGASAGGQIGASPATPAQPSPSLGAVLAALNTQLASQAKAQGYDPSNPNMVNAPF